MPITASSLQAGVCLHRSVGRALPRNIAKRQLPSGLNGALLYEMHGVRREQADAHKMLWGGSEGTYPSLH